MKGRMALLFALLALGCNKPQNDKPNPVMDNGDKAPPKKSAYAERLATFKEAIEKGRVSEGRVKALEHAQTESYHELLK